MDASDEDGGEGELAEAYDEVEAIEEAIFIIGRRQTLEEKLASVLVWDKLRCAKKNVPYEPRTTMSDVSSCLLASALEYCVDV